MELLEIIFSYLDVITLGRVCQVRMSSMRLSVADPVRTCRCANCGAWCPGGWPTLPHVLTGRSL